MINPLDEVPLNTLKSYVTGTTINGCKIYMPVDSNVRTVQLERKKELQEWLNQQHDTPPEPKQYA